MTTTVRVGVTFLGVAKGARKRYRLRFTYRIPIELVTPFTYSEAVEAAEKKLSEIYDQVVVRNVAFN